MFGFGKLFHPEATNFGQTVARPIFDSRGFSVRPVSPESSLEVVAIHRQLCSRNTTYDKIPGAQSIQGPIDQILELGVDL